MRPHRGRSSGGIIAIAAEIDGYIWGQNDGTYATARSTSSGYNETGTTMVVGQYLSVTTYVVDRGFLSFNTSTIPEGAVLTAVTLYITGGEDQSATDFNLDVYRYAWTETLTANREANYDGAYGGTATSEGTLRATSAGWVDGTVYSMAVDPTGINVAGDTKYTLVSSRDVAGTTPTAFEYVRIYTTEQTGSGPYLSITYTL